MVETRKVGVARIPGRNTEIVGRAVAEVDHRVRLLSYGVCQDMLRSHNTACDLRHFYLKHAQWLGHGNTVQCLLAIEIWRL